MFFTGIFTTHLPYIVMVTFYAYFLIFGVEKASKGEIVSDSFVKIEIETENLQFDISEVNNYYFPKKYNVFRFAFLENFEIKSRLKYPSYLYPDYKQDDYYYSKLSRPPPKA